MPKRARAGQLGLSNFELRVANVMKAALDSGSPRQLSSSPTRDLLFIYKSGGKIMYAVEFQAKVKNGAIEIPGEYKTRFKGRVRVILLVEEESPVVNFIDHLLQHPVHIAGFKPFTRDEVYERA
jgi:hypothetical protein